MKRTLLLTLMFLAALGSFSAQAEDAFAVASYFNGSTLHDMCRNFGAIPSNKVEIFQQGTCSGYVIATFEMQVETLQFQRKDRTIKNHALKAGPLPGLHSTTEQLVAIVNNYLNAHPERWNEGASVLVQDSLYDAFWKGKTVLTAK